MPALRLKNHGTKFSALAALQHGGQSFEFEKVNLRELMQTGYSFFIILANWKQVNAVLNARAYCNE